jgi:thiol-disulfide isomerase/thioredoxin
LYFLKVLKMKNLKIIAVIICIAALAACDGGNKYVIKGVAPDDMLNGETVFLSDYSADAVIDSTKIVGGKFVFEGIADEVKAIRLTCNELYVDCILEKGTIKVDLADTYGAKGTPLNNILNDFSSKSEDIIRKAREEFINIDVSLLESEKQELQEKIVTELCSKIDTLHVSFLREHHDDALSAVIFYSWMQNQMELSPEKFDGATKLVSDKVLNFGPIRQIAGFYGKLNETSAGKMFIDFTVENGNKDGSPASLSDYAGKGKYVLVDFWASWCAPCRMTTPVIAEVYNKYKGDKFEVVSVAVWDERENTLAAIEEDGCTWPQILDAQTLPAEIYGIQGIPHLMLIGPDGTILARDLRGDKLKAKVAEVMN